MKPFVWVGLLCYWLVAPTQAGKIRVDGLLRSSPQRVDQEIQCSDPCDSIGIAHDLARLENLGIFAQVEATQDSLGTLTYRVLELPWGLPVPNGRVSDEDGISVGAGVKAPNLFGQAIAGEFLFLLGRSLEVQASAAARRLAIPLGWEIFYAKTDRQDQARAYHERSDRAFLRLDGPTNWRGRFLAKAEWVGLRSTPPEVLLSGGNRDDLFSVGLGGIWDGRDRLSLTQRGLYQELLVERSGGPIGGDSNGWVLTSDTRVWAPIRRAWGIHGSFLSENQIGKMGLWHTWVLGGANTVRGAPQAAVVARSEQLASLELRWLALPPRPVHLLGQDLYAGLQAVGGADMGWAKTDAGQQRLWGCFGGFDIILPFVERIRLGAGVGSGGLEARFLLGLFEKTQAQRFRVR